MIDKSCISDKPLRPSASSAVQFIRAVILIALLAFVAPICSATDLTLRYDHPAPDTPQGWERQALPIGNGRIGAMVFAGLAREHLQFNDISLWTGDEKVKGSYQAFGNLYINLPDHDAGSTDYERSLDLATAVHTVTYKHNSVTYRREMFASHPAQVIVVQLSADKPAAYTGSIELADMHDAKTVAAENTLAIAGNLADYVPPEPPRGLTANPKAVTTKSTNHIQYEARARVLNDGGKLTAKDGVIAFTNCNSITIVLAAGTSYTLDYEKQFTGDDPHPRVAAQLDAAAIKWFNNLRSEHDAEYQPLFDRVKLNLGETAADRAALPTDQRLAVYTKEGNDPGLEAMFFQYGRYLLIASSRDLLPANLQGLWNQSNSPPWQADYHTNINIQMNYWLAEPANLSECTKPLFDMCVALLPPLRKATAAEADQKKDFRTPDGSHPVRGWTVRTEQNPFGARLPVEQNRQRLVRAALLGALRLHAR